MFEFTKLPPLALYVHVPWCVRKCPYCDFNSHQVKSGIPEAEYIEALLLDLEQELPKVWGRKITSIFIGGGTPSTLSPNSFEALIGGIRARIPVSPNAEITMEANPGTLDNEKLAGFHEAGINRLSIGIQSFNPAHLKSLGRIHSADDAINAVTHARNAGFDNINLDLMFALPGQTLEQAKRDLETAIALQPEHLSYYHLTIEPNTFFYRHPPTVPDNDLAYAMLEQGQELMQISRYQQYEVSAYSKSKHNCRHNLNYWNFGDYLGIGAGAHQKVSRADTQTITRSAKHRHPDTYINAMASQQFTNSENELGENEVLFEFLMNGLRIQSGFSIETFVTNTGLDKDILLDAIKNSCNNGLIETHGEMIQASKLGYAHLDSLLIKLSEEIEQQ